MVKGFAMSDGRWSKDFGFGCHLLAEEGDIYDDCPGEHKDDCVGAEAKYVPEGVDSVFCLLLIEGSRFRVQIPRMRNRYACMHICMCVRDR
jgi:hypothetical protein